jgi:hypothetical protein
MMMREGRRALPRSVAEASLVLLVFFTGLLVGAKRSPTPADWFGFAGALIGAGVTVAGSVYVLEYERRRQGRERRTLLLALLGDVDAACTPFQVANERALLSRYGKTAMQQANELVAAVSRLKSAGRSLTLSSIQMMKLSDAIDALRIDPGFQREAEAAGLYPDDGDFGELNAIAHEVMSGTATIWKLVEPRKPWVR